MSYQLDINQLDNLISKLRAERFVVDHLTTGILLVVREKTKLGMKFLISIPMNSGSTITVQTVDTCDVEFTANFLCLGDTDLVFNSLIFILNKLS